MAGKVGGKILAVVDGLTISVKRKDAKRAGKNRLWVQIRQKNKPKKWRVSTCLAYARGLDLQFLEEPEQKKKGKGKVGK